MEEARESEAEGFLRLAREEWDRSGVLRLDWVETGLKAALMRDGARMLGELLSKLPLERDASEHGEECQGKRTRRVETVLGPIELARNYYYDRRKDKGRYPLDEVLGLIGGYSPGLARLMCWAGAQSSSYCAASEVLRRHGGLEVEARQIQRMVGQLGPSLAEVLDRDDPSEQEPRAPTVYVSMDATGVPMAREELEGRVGKQPDGSAKTREVKLGCVFTQHHRDEEGRPWRDLDSTSYVGSFETAADFGPRLRREAERRNAFQASELILIGDGAPWIWEQARIHFPTAVQILDFYHASEHLKLLAEALHPDDEPNAQSTLRRWQECLRQDQLDQIITEALLALPRSGPRRQEADRQLAYLETNRLRMQYGSFQKRGWFIGSGVIEAGCKTLIAQRLKQSGMFWSLEGAQNILTFRCASSSRRFDQAWDRLRSQLALPA